MKGSYNNVVNKLGNMPLIVIMGYSYSYRLVSRFFLYYFVEQNKTTITDYIVSLVKGRTVLNNEKNSKSNSLIYMSIIWEAKI